MRKWGAVLVGGVILLSMAAPVNAAAPKAGASCSKLGQTSSSSGIKYTCVKSGKKLVWNKGVSVKAAAKPDLNPVLRPTEPLPVTPALPVETKNLLRSDPRITPTNNLTSLETCKTTDKTPAYGAKGITFYPNGFPRPAQTLTGKNQAKVLVIPLSFKDLHFDFEKIIKGNYYENIHTSSI